jgi:glutamine amidotransferase-like uncharacterized protein
MQGQQPRLLHERHLSNALRAAALLAAALLVMGASPQVVRVGLYNDPQATDPKSREAAWRVMKASPELSVERVTRETVMSPDFAQKFDVLVLPGGTANGQARSLGADGCRRVTEYTRNGGGVIGICAGGYLIVNGWNPLTREIELLNATSWDDNNWDRGEQFISVELAGSADDSASSRTMWFENGPIYVPGESQANAYVPLVRYVTDLAKKGAPTGMMTGRDAVIAGSFGKGRAVAFGPHPELSEGLNHWLVNAIKWCAANDDGTSASADAVLEGRAAAPAP